MNVLIKNKWYVDNKIVFLTCNIIMFIEKDQSKVTVNNAKLTFNHPKGYIWVILTRLG